MIVSNFDLNDCKHCILDVENESMLNFWRKVLEKRTLPNTNTTKNINILDPRYDGPLSGFVAKIEGNIKLEKCWVSPVFSDIFENKLLLNSFKQYLESKMLLSLMRIYEIANAVVRNDCNITDRYPDNENIFRENYRPESNYNTCSSNNDSINEMNDLSNSSSTDALSNDPFIDCRTILSNELLKLPDDVQFRIHAVIKFSNTVDLNDKYTEILKCSVVSIMEEHWTDFSRSEWFCRYQVELLTRRCITLGDIMLHNAAFTYFMEFLEHESCQTLVEFWLAATNFEQFVINCQQNEKYDPNQALNDAINIYEKYLSLQATCPLGFSDNVRYVVEEAICEEVNAPRSDCFHIAVETVMCYLRQYCLESFFSSQHYVHLLSETIRNSSTGKSEHSPSSSVAEYTVDNKNYTARKSDPESIWLRRKQNGLSFGRIDPFGRFQRNLEPDPDRKNESKITRTVKKWVQKTENKAQEEMAWQVAEMVVKDITSLTMGCQTEDDS